MKIAGSTLLYSRLPLDEACRRVSELGFDAVDVGMQEGWAHIDPSEVVGAVGANHREVETVSAAADLAPVAINASAGDVDLDTEIERVEAIAAVAEKLDTNVITLPAASADSPIADDFDRFRALTRAVEDMNVTLTVETHWGTHTEDPGVAAEYVKAVPRLRYTLDPGHFYIGDHDIDPPYRDLLNKVDHVHIRQAGTGWEEIQMPVLEGDIDIETFVDDLSDAGYDGVITVEYIDALDGVDPLTAQRQASAMRKELCHHL